jgi:hypothetical protein
MAMAELTARGGKNMGADALIPFLVLVVAKAFEL